MAKILNYLLGTIFFILLIIVIMMVFKIPPFVKTATTPPTTPPAPSSTATTTGSVNLPKVPVDKTYQDYISHAQVLEQSNYPSLAIAEYQAALNKYPDQLDPLYAIGKIYLRTADFAKAEETFNTILKKKPGDLSATIYLARSYLGQRKVDQAKALLDPVMNEDQQLYYYKGIIAAYFGNYQTSRDDLNKANNIPGADDIKAKINNFLASYSEYDFNAESPTVHLKLLLARSYDQCGEYQLAIGTLFDITKEKADYRDAWILLGHAYLEINQPNDALEALQRAVALDPDKPETHFFLGLAEYSLNQYDNAINDLIKARDLGYQPSIQIDQKLAEIYLLQQNFNLSAQSYEHVLASVNADPNYYIKPVWIYLEKLNQPQKAIALANNAVKLFPNNAMSHNLLGWSYIYSEQFGQAETELKTALQLNPNLDAIYLNYGLLFEKQNQDDKAMSFYKKANQMGNGDSISQAASQRYNLLLAKINPNSTAQIQANILQP